MDSCNFGYSLANLENDNAAHNSSRGNDTIDNL